MPSRRARRGAGVDGEQPVGIELAARHLDALHAGSRRRAARAAGCRRRGPAARRCRSRWRSAGGSPRTRAEQRAALLLVHQRDQRVADLDAERIDGRWRARARPAAAPRRGLLVGVGLAGRLAVRRRPPPPSIAATTRNGSFGQAGDQRRARRARRPPIASGRARASSWPATSSPRFDSDAARVVIRPPDIETSSAGIAVTRPSPTVRMV